jgi:hypothetical protein
MKAIFNGRGTVMQNREEIRAQAERDAKEREVRRAKGLADLRAKVSELDELHKTIKARRAEIEKILTNPSTSLDLPEVERILREKADLEIRQQALQIIERPLRKELSEAETRAAHAREPRQQPWHPAPPPPGAFSEGDVCKSFEPDPAPAKQYFYGREVDKR